MKTRIAKITHWYAGHTRHVGEPYEVEDQHVEILLLAGRIEPQEGDPGFQGRDMEATHQVPYSTRDMTAERTKRPHSRKAAQ